MKWLAFNKNNTLLVPSVLLAALFIVSACGGPLDEKAEKLLAEDKPAAALEALERALEKNPNDVYLNALAAEALARTCEELTCLQDPELSKQLATYLINVGNGALPEQGINAYDRLQPHLLPELANTAAMNAFLEFAQSLPPSPAQDRLQTAKYNLALTTLLTFETEPSLQLLNRLVEMRAQQDLTTHTLGFLAGLIQNDVLTLNTSLAGMKSRPHDSLAPAVIELFPATLLLHNVIDDPRLGAEAFAKFLSKNITQLGIPQLETEPARAALARGLQQLRAADNLANFVADHHNFTPPATPPEDLTVTATAIATPQVEGGALPDDESAPETVSEPDLPTDAFAVYDLFLQRQQLLLDPSQGELWSDFLPRAMTYVEAGGDADILLNLPTTGVPVSAVETYNKQLFALAARQIDRGVNALPTLKQIIIPEAGGRAYERERAALLQQGLNLAITNEDIAAVIAYTEFDPTIARQERQDILALMIEQMNSAWEGDLFDEILATAEFLREDLEIEFNLDGLLLQNFKDYLETLKLAAELRADSPTQLLKPQTEVAFDLGAKFTFLQDYFSTNPTVIDAQLKGIILDAPGIYGRAVAMYRLQHYFDDALFPPAQREAYLVNALRDGLNDDVNLSASELLNIGTELNTIHPTLSKIFVIEEALSRTTDLLSALELWQNSPATMQQTMATLKPQFTAVMNAAEAVSDSRYNAAATALLNVSNPDYLQLAEEIIEDIQTETAKLAGSYLASFSGPDQPIWILQISAAITPLTELVKARAEQIETTAGTLPAPIQVAAETAESAANVATVIPALPAIKLTAADLTGLNLTAYSAVGTITDPAAAQQLKTSLGHVTRAQTAAIYRIDDRSVDLTQVGGAFAKTFGTLENIVATDTGLAGQLRDGQQVSFNQLSTEGILPILPQGRFGITAQVTAPNSTTDHLLPVGSIVDLKVNLDKPLQPVKNGKPLGIILPVAGVLRHPAAPQPLDVTGFFDVERLTTNLRYQYPYGAGGANVEARVRCQIAGASLRCAGHNKHWDRQQYHHVVVGRRGRGGPAEVVIETVPANPEPAELSAELPFDSPLPPEVLDFPDLFE